MVLEHYKTELELAQYVSKLEAQVKGYKALCERLQAQADEMRSACQWISVEDRLPEEGQRIVILLADGEHFAGKFNTDLGSDDYRCLDRRTGRYWYGWSYWIPLPAAPTPTNGDSHD